jgi:DNA-binding HxlR family transcriptional regulator
MSARETKNRKCYLQRCPLARALDVVGDRWTILILRELLGGPAHFQDLHEGLPGIPKNLLSTRLRRLESDGVVRRLRQSNTSLYALSERGAAIREALEQLAFWGAGLQPVAPPEHERSLRAIAMALQAILVRTRQSDPVGRRVVELEVDGQSLEVALGARPTVSVRPVMASEAHVRTSYRTLSRYLDQGTLDRRRFVHLSGDRTVTEELLDALDQAA